jgi:hypothetical protein
MALFRFQVGKSIKKVKRNKIWRIKNPPPAPN